MDSLGSTLRKGGIRDPLLFFPLQKRGQPGIVTNHFRQVGLNQAAEYLQKRAIKDTREAVLGRLAEMRKEPEPTAAEGADESTASATTNGGASSYSNDEIVEFLQEQRAKTGLSMEDFTPILFDGLTKSLTHPTDQAAAESNAVRQVQSFAPLLEPFVPNNAKAEILLINKVQLWCYENDMRLQKAFVPILKVLYNADVISDQAILYWYGKGARAEGKAEFLKAAAPLAKYLEELSDDEEDEE